MHHGTQGFHGTLFEDYCHRISCPRFPSGQGMGSWLACNEFDPSTTKDPPCRGEMHVKSVESSNILPLVVVWYLGGGASSGVILVT
ncbi:hypothetical protein TNCV_1698051 [Trichonephila clavipes]|nr:hypothetical protein TNCV_1698051 [Trichonephila clavipes]